MRDILRCTVYTTPRNPSPHCRVLYIPHAMHGPIPKICGVHTVHDIAVSEWLIYSTVQCTCMYDASGYKVNQLSLLHFWLGWGSIVSCGTVLLQYWMFSLINTAAAIYGSHSLVCLSYPWHVVQIYSTAVRHKGTRVSRGHAREHSRFHIFVINCGKTYVNSRPQDPCWSMISVHISYTIVRPHDTCTVSLIVLKQDWEFAISLFSCRSFKKIEKSGSLS